MVLEELNGVTDGVDDVNPFTSVSRTRNHDGQDAIATLGLARIFQRLAFLVCDFAHLQKQRVVAAFWSCVVDGNVAVNSVECSDEDE